MAEWLVAHFTLFGVPVQRWMPLAVAVILVGVLLARRNR